MGWISFIVAFAVLIIVSRKSLWLGMLLAAFLLGIMHLSFVSLLEITYNTIADSSVFLMAIAVGIIPIIGGIVQESGILERMTNSLRINRKLFLMLSPAFIGLMPIPGGALLSCPLVRHAGDDISNDEYVAINLWFRHIFIIIYPLGTLLICSKMAEISLYTAVLYLLPAPFVMGIIGYFFLLRKIDGHMNETAKLSPEPRTKALGIPLLIFLSAPVIHVLLMLSGIFPFDEIPLVIALTISLSLAIGFGKVDNGMFAHVLKVMKPLRFFLLIIAIFIFLNVFKATEVASLISTLVISKNFLIIVIALVITFLTGRMQVGFSIVLPIYLASYGDLDMMTFTVMYISVFLGYLISPVHPCLSLSLEYFRTTFTRTMKLLAMPILIILVLLYGVALLI
jgi:integral membrane protein (TIGR00529 family)